MRAIHSSSFDIPTPRRTPLKQPDAYPRGSTTVANDQLAIVPSNLNRWYDAAIGRWISEDPIGFEGGDANLVRYVGNNVTLLSDPSGLHGPAFPCEPAPPGSEFMKDPRYSGGNGSGSAAGGRSSSGGNPSGTIRGVTDEEIAEGQERRNRLENPWPYLSFEARFNIMMNPAMFPSIRPPIHIGHVQGVLGPLVCARPIRVPSPPPPRYPTDPSQWTPPPGWTETSAGSKTGGRHRQWNDGSGKVRRWWDRQGREAGMERGPHWHDLDDISGGNRHIDPDH